MPVMSAEQRRALWRDLMQELSRAREPIALTKTDLRIAIDAVDQWAVDNAASFNAALPQPARGQLTPAQKARLLALVVTRRYQTGA